MGDLGEYELGLGADKKAFLTILLLNQVTGVGWLGGEEVKWTKDGFWFSSVEECLVCLDVAGDLVSEKRNCPSKFERCKQLLWYCRAR